MTTKHLAAQQLPQGSVAAFGVRRKPANLWLDAWRRLIRNRAAAVGGVVILLLILIAIFADRIAPYDYAEGDSNDNFMVPLWLAKALPGDMEDYAQIGNKFILGADYLGRDLLSRLIYGARVSLPVGFVGAMTAFGIGLVYGCISGYYGGRADSVMMRIVDFMYAFPTMLLIILIMSVFKSTFGAAQEPGAPAHIVNQVSRVMDSLLGLEGSGMLFIFVGIGVTAWMDIARLARGQILSIKEKAFVEAARMVGAGDLWIIVRHILPNIIGPVLVSVTLSIPSYILMEVFLSFIGLGVDPPTPSWGSMISDGAGAMRSYPNQVLFPALVLALTMFAFNFLGDGLRDALDPRMKGAL